jgi:NAD(P)-dependent dehydrogenase (short-subunit alcohol dehydrogenase family)
MTKSRPSPGRSARVALVTGGNRGIGLELCRQLAERNFVVLLTARDAAKATSAAKKLGQVGRVEPVALDVAKASSIKKAAAEVASRHGYLDVLVNNAGITHDADRAPACGGVRGR